MDVTHFVKYTGYGNPDERWLTHVSGIVCVGTYPTAPGCTCFELQKVVESNASDHDFLRWIQEGPVSDVEGFVREKLSDMYPTHKLSLTTRQLESP